jgi:hypothetical protein
MSQNRPALSHVNNYPEYVRKYLNNYQQSCIFLLNRSGKRSRNLHLPGRRAGHGPVLRTRQEEISKPWRISSLPHRYKRNIKIYVMPYIFRRIISKLSLYNELEKNKEPFLSRKICFIKKCA